VIKPVSDLRQVGGFLRVILFPDHHTIAKILLNVALKTIKQIEQVVVNLTAI
jgi:hypothetical protein